MALVRPVAGQITLRGDTDFSHTGQLDRWDDQGLKFILGLDAHSKGMPLAEALSERSWQPLERLPKYEILTEPRRRRERVKEQIVVRQGYLNQKRVAEHVSDMTYQPHQCEREYRLVIVRKNISVQKGERILFDELRYTGTTGAGGICGIYNSNAPFYSQSGDANNGGVLPNMSGPRVAFLLSGTPNDRFLQTLNAQLQPSTIHTITVAIGIRNNADVFGGYQVELLTNGQSVGNATVGDRNTLNALAGGNATHRFTVVTNTYTSTNTVAPNQQVAVRIIKPNGGANLTYLDFDNVQVTSQLTPMANGSSPTGSG